jgi:hypothetical protein
VQVLQGLEPLIGFENWVAKAGNYRRKTANPEVMPLLIAIITALSERKAGM